MSRICRVTPGPIRIENARRGVQCGGLLWLLSVFILSGHASGASTIRIAVAPFAGERSGGEASAAERSADDERALSVADALTGRLAQRSLDRLLAPGDFVAVQEFDPRAEEIRRWAYNAAVDAILVGRVSSTERDRKNDALLVEVVVRSGHSGAELSRHDVVVSGRANLLRSIDELATAILLSMGYVDAPPEDPAEDSGASAGHVPADAEDPPRTGSSGRGLDAALALSGFESDAPIEIKADEAEIITSEDGRELIFQRNVWVHQANVTLRSDRLEASYRRGESEPRSLVAEGSVQIEQGDRRAKCDRAIYLSEVNKLTCRGHAELVQGCDIVRGELIEFDLAVDRARVEGAASIVIRPKDDKETPCRAARGTM